MFQSYSTKFIDVSALGNLSSLNLRYCINIRDVSMLSNIPNFTFIKYE